MSPSSRRFVISRCSALMVWVVLAGCASELAAQDTQSTANSLLVLCAAEQPVVAPGQKAALRAWVATREGKVPKQNLEYQWVVDTGSIEGSGPRVYWKIENVAVGPSESKLVKASVIARGATAVSVRCELEVIVAQPSTLPPDTRGTAAALSFLKSGDTEEIDFGLYSYLLFGSKPSEVERERYLKVIEAFLRVVPPLSELERWVASHKELNATYIPVKYIPESGRSDREFAEAVLEVYDYARAKVLLGRLGDDYAGGPYIVSARRPLSHQEASAYLFEDLRTVVPDLLQPWIEAFSWLTVKERSWSEASLRKFRLNLRNVIRVAGDGVPGVFDAVEHWIQFLRQKP